ncbi:MAG: FHA domain-containing protein [Myxococcota bacterium]
MHDVPVLVCTDGALAGQAVRVPEGGLGIGRSDDNGLVLPDDGVSRYHARLLYDNGSLWLQDAGSRNGVFVNDKRVTGHKALKVGDVITIAQHTFELKWEDDLESAEPERDTQRPGEDPRKRRWFWPFS